MISTHAFANTIQLYNESHARRLFKARHHEMDAMEICTQTLTDCDVAKSLLSLPMKRNCTVYAFQIRSSATRTTGEKKDVGEWLLTKRYSEFVAFRNALLRLIRCWESKLEDSELKIQSREFELVSNSLRRPITPNFPRKHMRGDNACIVTERRRGLRDFVRKLLDAYADISVYLFNTPASRNERGAGQYLREIYDRLEEFLQVPEAQKELERRHTAAVLALEDVQVDKAQHGDNHRERACCICLDDYASDDDNDQSSCPRDSVSEEGQTEVFAKDKMVKLPCGHHFHEDCVIEWFNASVTCPLCRLPPVRDDAPPSFDITGD